MLITADHTIKYSDWQLMVENRSRLPSPESLPTQGPDVTVTLSQSHAARGLSYRLIRHRRDRHRCAHVQSLVCVSWGIQNSKIRQYKHSDISIPFFSSQPVLLFSFLLITE
jgi:hypothetical protein